MKPWREVAVPHQDVLEGTFQQSEFAADITAVNTGKASREYQDAGAFFDRTFITEGMALLLTQALKDSGRIAGLVLIAPAVDMTRRLMWDTWSKAARKELETTGVCRQPSDYSDEPYPITRALIEDGRRHLIMGASIATGCPVRILQGAKDPDVPWQHAFRLTSLLPAEDVVFTLIQDGDHRLSREQDIARMLAAVDEF